MKDKVKKHLDDLFADVYDTKQLRELKEEISANLLEKINDLIAKGNSEDAAIKKAVSSLGDMSELVESLKKASERRLKQDMFDSQPIDRKHVIGYVVASAVLLFGIMLAGIVYLQHKGLWPALGYLMPFILVAAPIYIFMGLTQETTHEYGMNSKRALTYSVASEILLMGAAAAGIEYFLGQRLLLIFSTLMPFVIISAIIFIYLGLTEKSRTKMDSEWVQQWINYYSNPQTAMVHGTLSGALWIFSFAAFFLVAFIWGWKFSWLVFIFAIGFQVLMEAYIAAKKK